MIPYNYAEEEVYDFIKSCCSKDEPSLFMPLEILRGKHSMTLVPDIYLPEGCRLLGIHPKTCIEVKANLQYDTFSRMMAMYDFIQDHLKDRGIRLMLVTMEKVDRPHPVYNRLAGRNIEIVYFDDLKERRQGAVYETRQFVFNDLKSAQKAFLEGPNTLFLGAGVSMDEKLPGWKKLLGLLHTEATGKALSEQELDDLIEANDHSSIILGRYMRRLFKDDDIAMRDAIHKILYDGRDFRKIGSKTIHKICELVQRHPNTVKSIVTYNYDDLIEQQLSNINVSSASIYDTHDPDNRFPVYHVHGILDYQKLNMSRIVLSEDSYHEQYRRSFMWSNVEQLHALQNHNCFFIGLSMTDPNLRRLLDFARSEANSRNQRDIHCFAFLRKSGILRNVKSEPKAYLKDQSRMLEDLGVRVIWYNQHSELPELLEKLHNP